MGTQCGITASNSAVVLLIYLLQNVSYTPQESQSTAAVQVIHGSGPNLSGAWRKAYVLAFRKTACVAEERKYGFTHSHNSDFNWDQWIQSKEASTRAD